MNPIISVIIPAKDEEKAIEATIKQFLPYKKKYSAEVIVSDGGSSDKTESIAKEYADRVVLSKGGKNTIAQGRNMGAKKARGNILIFIDGAIRVPDVPLLFESALKVGRERETAAATMDVFIYPWEEKTIDRLMYVLGNLIVRLTLITGIYIVKGECQIIKKGYFDKVNGFNEKMVVAEDSDLYRRLAKLGKIVYLKKIKVYDSPRRFRQEGYIKSVWLYTINNLLALFGKKPVSKEWKPIR
ncbi:MAG TPA: glycosyltransferase [Candidatus Nanoarchaeia archaeon]|nr:glycosyltransferase [Candidatus Nanoarchaeia archaeon]